MVGETIGVLIDRVGGVRMGEGGGGGEWRWRLEWVDVEDEGFIVL